MLSLRPDEQEMAAVSCKELSSSLSDDFVLMGVGCSMGREAAEILMEASLGSGSMGMEVRGDASPHGAKGQKGSSPLSQQRWAHRWMMDHLNNIGLGPKVMKTVIQRGDSTP